MFVHKFVDTIYERQVTFVVGPAKEYQQYLRSLGIKARVTKRACGETSTHELESPFYPGFKTKFFFVWLVRFDGSSRDKGTLAHECWHITQDIMEELGIEYILDDNNEPFAYYCDALVRQFLEAWHERV